MNLKKFDVDKANEITKKANKEKKFLKKIIIKSFQKF